MSEGAVASLQLGAPLRRDGVVGDEPEGVVLVEHEDGAGVYGVRLPDPACGRYQRGRGSFRVSRTNLTRGSDAPRGSMAGEPVREAGSKEACGTGCLWSVKGIGA